MYPEIEYQYQALGLLYFGIGQEFLGSKDIVYIILPPLRFVIEPNKMLVYKIRKHQPKWWQPTVRFVRTQEKNILERSKKYGGGNIPSEPEGGPGVGGCGGTMVEARWKRPGRGGGGGRKGTPGVPRGPEESLYLIITPIRQLGTRNHF